MIRRNDPVHGTGGKGGMEGAGIFEEDPRRGEPAAGPVRVARREVRPDHAAHCGLGEFRLSRDRRYRRLRLTAATVTSAASPAHASGHGINGPDSPGAIRLRDDQASALRGCRALPGSPEAHAVSARLTRTDAMGIGSSSPATRRRFSISRPTPARASRTPMSPRRVSLRIRSAQFSFPTETLPKQNSLAVFLCLSCSHSRVRIAGHAGVQQCPAFRPCGRRFGRQALTPTMPGPASSNPSKNRAMSSPEVSLRASGLGCGGEACPATPGWWGGESGVLADRGDQQDSCETTYLYWFRGCSGAGTN